jgi:hypothetical protein
VSVKLVAVIVAGAIDVLNTAVMAVLVGTAAVGPGLVVGGTVIVTLGRVTLAVTPVVNCHT